ncbi:hypothetical protein FLONG3_10648 [Fusarium longipes]|uniref:Uncharacterized protein n=1 Tax=Fusarium longipes TaxID=694270 RepID=A0A395RM09_9HYPO|nr:hypothetical protein FLONG3_10648 [Fusarium longipes]
MEDEDFTALKQLRDSIADTASPSYQLAQIESPEYIYGDFNRAGDSMEWAFLEEPPVVTKTATSFVDSGFHDESGYVSERSPAAAVPTPAAVLSVADDKDKWPDAFVWPPIGVAI